MKKIFLLGFLVLILLSLFALLVSAAPSCSAEDIEECIYLDPLGTPDLEGGPCGYGFKCISIMCTGSWNIALGTWDPPGSLFRCFPCTETEIEAGSCGTTTENEEVNYEYASNTVSVNIPCPSEGDACTNNCAQLSGNCSGLWCRDLSTQNNVVTPTYEIYATSSLGCSATLNNCTYSYCSNRLPGYDALCTQTSGSWAWVLKESVSSLNKASGEFCCDDEECSSNNCVSNVCLPATETSCNDNSDNDGDGFFDEQDSDCSLSLSVDPNPANYTDTLTATISGDGNIYGTTNICDWQGCTSAGLCVNSQLCSTSGSSCILSATPNPGYGLTNSYSYYACNKENSASDTITVKGPYCGDGNCDSGDGETSTNCNADCKDSNEVGSCNDGLDNDGDGLKDEADPDCPITLKITPDPTTVNDAEQAKITANDGSLNLDNKQVKIARSSSNCLSNVVCTITSGNTCNFNAPSWTGAQIYYACTDSVNRANDWVSVCVDNVGSSCNDNNACTTNDKVSCYGVCQGTIIAGVHKDCSGTSCVNVANTAAVCTDQCNLSSECGGASVCGNGVKESGEQCDGSDLGGANCNSLSYDAGTLSCDGSCNYVGCYDYEDCTLGTGDEDLDTFANYDSSDGTHGDSDCAIGVSNLVSPNVVTPSSVFEATCKSTAADVNSVGMTFNGNNCAFDHWAIDNAVFNCTAPSGDGTYELRCFVDTSKSHAITGESQVVKTVGVCSGVEVRVKVVDNDDVPVGAAKITVIKPEDKDVVEYSYDNGDYVSLGTFSVGDELVFVTEKDTYPTLSHVVDLTTCGANNIDLNIEGSSCNADCTDAENYCDASCDGINGCQFDGVLSKEVADLCDGYPQGTMIDYNETHMVYCCGNSNSGISFIKKIDEELNPNGCMRNLAQHKRLVNYGGQPVSIITYTWDECD